MENDQNQQNNPQDTSICYLHNVSPIKNGNGTKYFDFVAQYKSHNQRGVCWSPQKRKHLSELNTAKSPVKFAKFTQNARGELVVKNVTTVTPYDHTKVSFDYDNMIDGDELVTLQYLDKLQPWQMVKVKAHVSNVNEITDHHLPNKEIIKKQVLTIVDEDACCNLVLFGEYVDSLEKGSTYILENVRIRKVSGVIYLNTTPLADFKFEKTEDFPHIAREDTPESNTTETYKVVGVSKIHQSYFCKMCLRKGKVVDNIFNCEKCSTKVTKTAASTKLSMTLPMENVNSKEQLLLYFNNDSTMAMVGIYDIKDLDGDELAKFFFNEGLPPVQLTIDTMSKTVLNVEPST